MEKIKNTFGCLTFIIMIIANILIGAWSVAEILTWFGKDIPMIGDAILGLFLAEITVPVAIIGWLLRFFGAF